MATPLSNSTLSPTAAVVFAAAAARWFPEASQEDMPTALAVAAKFVREGGAFPHAGVEDPYDAVYRIGALLGGENEQEDPGGAWTSRIEAALLLGIAQGIQMRDLAASADEQS